MGHEEARDASDFSFYRSHVPHHSCTVGRYGLYKNSSRVRGIRSVFQVSDKWYISSRPRLTYRATSSKPNWLLTPLPFSQLRPDYEPQSTSAVKTLSSCTLTAISLKFDQFSLESFASLPPHLIRRIIARVRADRNYDEDMYGRINIHPDETTIWATQALYLPQEADDHVLGLPCVHLLQRMQGHPITLLPTLDIRDPAGLAAPSTFRFLTTISLNNSNGPIDDQNVQGLRWCTHLTALWMQGCSVSDYGITLLASALELPGLKGMCRLRAWSLIGCKGVTDKSIKTFAKFPGLVMLGTFPPNLKLFNLTDGRCPRDIMY
jgi:hypothetical protein